MKWYSKYIGFFLNRDNRNRTKNNNSLIFIHIQNNRDIRDRDFGNSFAEFDRRAPTVFLLPFAISCSFTSFSISWISFSPKLTTVERYLKTNEWSLTEQSLLKCLFMHFFQVTVRLSMVVQLPRVKWKCCLLSRWKAFLWESDCWILRLQPLKWFHFLWGWLFHLSAWLLFWRIDFLEICKSNFFPEVHYGLLKALFFQLSLQSSFSKCHISPRKKHFSLLQPCLLNDIILWFHDLDFNSCFSLFF